jgi:uncharacterized membrane protein YfcA
MLVAALCFFAFIAGFIDAIVGGGGLVQLPAMFVLQPQLTLMQTLATNKTANFMGTLVAAVRYIRRVEIDWKHLAPALLSAFIGSFGGALLVSYLHKEQFMPFIICILALVLLYTIFKRELGLHRTEKHLSDSTQYVYALCTGLLIGVYDGVIGPGTGSFLIFAFIVLFGYDFIHASANAKVINCVTNIAALIFFLSKGAVVWELAIPLAVANMLGSYAGSHIALKKGSKFVRVFFIAVVTVLIIKLGYDHIFS